MSNPAYPSAIIGNKLHILLSFDAADIIAFERDILLQQEYKVHKKNGRPVHHHRDGQGADAPTDCHNCTTGSVCSASREE